MLENLHKDEDTSTGRAVYLLRNKTNNMYSTCKLEGSLNGNYNINRFLMKKHLAFIGPVPVSIGIYKIFLVRHLGNETIYHFYL